MKNNTKASITNKMSKVTNIPKGVSKEILNALLSVIKKKATSMPIKIHEFGTFYMHTTPKRIGRNPKTKESYIIHPMKKIVFKSSNKIKEILN